MNENERETDKAERGMRKIFIKRGCRKSEGKSVKMRRNRRGILKDGEKKGGREREESQRRESHAETERSGSSPHSPQYMWVQCYTKIFLLLFY